MSDNVEFGGGCESRSVKQLEDEIPALEDVYIKVSAMKKEVAEWTSGDMNAEEAAKASTSNLALKGRVLIDLYNVF